MNILQVLNSKHEGTKKTRHKVYSKNIFMKKINIFKTFHRHIVIAQHENFPMTMKKTLLFIILFNNNANT